MNPPRATLSLACLLVVAALLGARAADRTERWYEVKVAGRLAGWMRSVEAAVPEGWRTETETRLRLSRGGVTLDMVNTGWIVESADGKPISGGRTQVGSGQSVRVTWKYGPDGVAERTIEGARIIDRKLPAVPADALPPHAADADADRHRNLGDAVIRQLVFEPTQGSQPQTVVSTRGTEETVSVAGVPVTATRWSMKGALVPPGSAEWRTAVGDLVRSLSPTGLGDIESILSTEERAKRALDLAGAPPEVMVASFAQPDRPLADPATLRRMRVRVTAMRDAIPVPPEMGLQRVSASGKGYEITVDLDKPPQPALVAEREDPAYLAASPMINTKDPLLIKLAAAAVADAPADMGLRLERLRAATFQQLSRKNLGSALASASEAARTRSGDCTEHAVLLAALLRAQGIPSRVVAGLVWCDQFAGKKDVFGWHLWTQALVDGRWIDLDATLPPGKGLFHPGHIALAATALSDPAGDPSWATLLAALGNLQVEVLDGARE